MIPHSPLILYCKYYVGPLGCGNCCVTETYVDSSSALSTVKKDFGLIGSTLVPVLLIHCHVVYRLMLQSQWAWYDMRFWLQSVKHSKLRKSLYE